MIYVVMDPSDDTILCVVDAEPGQYEAIEKARSEFRSKYRKLADDFSSSSREKVEQLAGMGRIEDYIAKAVHGKIVERYSKVY